jgi:hypothetical protein
VPVGGVVAVVVARRDGLRTRAAAVRTAVSLRPAGFCPPSAAGRLGSAPAPARSGAGQAGPGPQASADSDVSRRPEPGGSNRTIRGRASAKAAVPIGF